MGQSMNIPLRNIEENAIALREPQTDTEEFAQLRDSIERNGVLESLLVVPATDATGTHVKHNEAGEPLYRLIDGLQRYTAAKQLNIETVPANVLTAKSDLEVYELQVITNSCRVETKPAQYAEQISRMMGLDGTMTAAAMCKRLAKSESWLADRLGLLKLKASLKAKVDSGEIPLSNATVLAKLPPEEQEAFASDASAETNAIFEPKVKARLKQLRDAKRQGRDPEAAKTFIPTAHSRKLKDIEPVIASVPEDLVNYVESKGSTTAEIIKATLEWAVHLDDASITKAKADAEARKAKEEADKTKRKAEREALKEKEKAAIEKVRAESAAK